MTININLAGSTATVDIGIPDLEAKVDVQSARIDALTALITTTLLPRLDQILSKENLLMATQQEEIQALKDAFTAVDDATTQGAKNMQAFIALGQTIATEVTALKQAITDAGVPQALVEQASATTAHAQSLATGLSGFVPFMQQIATDAAQPVPVPVPPAPAPSPTPVVESTPAP